MTRLVAATLALLAISPFLAGSPAWSSLALATATAAILGQSWNMACGFGGLTSLGHAAFFGTGAYAAALLQTRTALSPWLSLPLAASLGALLGAAIALATLRAGARSAIFPLATLGLAEALNTLAGNLDSVGGVLGIFVPPHFGALYLQTSNPLTAYAGALALLACAAAATWCITRSRLSATLAGDPVTLRPGLAVLALSGAFAALAGVLVVQTGLAIDPASAFGPERSAAMLAVTMLGGSGTVLGPLIGAVVLQALLLAAHALVDTPASAPILYGLVLLLVLILRPRFTRHPSRA